MKNAIKTCAMKALAAIALAFAALTAQAAYIAPGITINGTTPTKDGSYSGYTYQDGVFTLTSSDATYTFAGEDTSGKVRIVAATGCKIKLASGFNLDLTKFTSSSAYDAPKASPISLSTTDTVSVEALGAADLWAGNGGAGIRVTEGQSLILLPSRTSRMYVLGYVGAGIGGGYSEKCGNIEIRGGQLYVQSIGDGSGIGDGGNAQAGSYSSKITIGMSAYVEARGGANGPGIGMTSYSVSDMDIWITGGATVVASGGGRSAGIGVAWRSEGSCSVTIDEGSTVTATGGTGGAGIGSATESTTSMQIYIGDAKVTATGGADAAGIGGGNTSKTPTVWIMGGTVFAKGDPDVVSVNDIGAGRNPETSATSSVTGGSVRLANGKGALTNDGTALNCVTVGGLAADGAVSVSLTTSKGKYGNSGVYADRNGCIYLWVPPADYSSIYVNDVRYTADARSGNAMAHSVQPPANDNFANAKVVSGESGRVGGSNVAATNESGLYVVTPTGTYDADVGGSVWYSWTASFTGTVCFQAEVLQEDVESLGGRPDISAYAGTSGSQLRYSDDSSNWACHPENEGFSGGRVRFNCTKGTTYKIIVYSSSGVEFPAFALAWDTADKADSWDASFGSDGTAKLLRGRFDSGALVIPASLFGCRVTEIGESLGGERGDITSVTIPEGVTKIGDSAFKRMGISSVTIPSTVTTIGKSAFEFCDNLQKVTMGSSVVSIGSEAFFECSALESIVLPASVRSVGVIAFTECTKLTTVTYLGDMPVVDDGEGGEFTSGNALYAGSSPTTSIVPANNATWADALAAGTWMAHPIRTAGSSQSYKVTFGKNGGTGGDNYVTATYGAAMPTPRTAPKLSGWTFAGYWDTLALDEKGNAKGKQYYDGSMKSVRAWDKTSATTLWAKWTNKVTLGKNGGTGGDSYVTCTKGQPMPKRTMPTKAGYVFDGYWTSTGTGGVKYYNADGTSAHAWDKGGSVTLWAKWVAETKVKVTFGKNGGTGGDNYVTATTGKAMPTPRTAPTLKGWSFGGYWDTLACDAKGNPLGKQYYNSKMESVRNWDKTTATTLWAKWTVKVTLGKNGGTGGDSAVTVIKGQPFPKRTMPTKSGYTFGGYFVSASSKTGQCYNPDGTGTASMKWSTGGTPTIWALWTKTSACVELPPAVALRVASAAPTAAPETAPQSAVSAGIYSGVLADGSGAFWLMLDEPEKDEPRTAYLYVASEDGSLTAECTALEAGGVLLLTTEDGAVYAFDPAAGMIVPAT